jgi:hypothetical protein
MNKGRILKIKPGYNPNSSSMAKSIVMFFAAAAAAAALFNSFAAVLYGKKGHDQSKGPETQISDDARQIAD